MCGSPVGLALAAALPCCPPARQPTRLPARGSASGEVATALRRSATPRLGVRRPSVRGRPWPGAVERRGSCSPLAGAAAAWRRGRGGHSRGGQRRGLRPASDRDANGLGGASFAPPPFAPAAERGEGKGGDGGIGRTRGDREGGSTGPGGRAENGGDWRRGAQGGAAEDGRGLWGRRPAPATVCPATGGCGRVTSGGDKRRYGVGGVGCRIGCGTAPGAASPTWAPSDLSRAAIFPVILAALGCAAPFRPCLTTLD